MASAGREHGVEGLRRAQRRQRGSAQGGGSSQRLSTHGIDAASGAIPEADVPRRGALGLVQAALGVVNTMLAVISAIAIAAAGVVLTWEVIGRYFFAIPSDWQDELSTFLLI